nr:hypothetical protein [Angustibacter aerolatus]
MSDPQAGDAVHVRLDVEPGASRARASPRAGGWWCAPDGCGSPDQRRRRPRRPCPRRRTSRSTPVPNRTSWGAVP